MGDTGSRRGAQSRISRRWVPKDDSPMIVPISRKTMSSLEYSIMTAVMEISRLPHFDTPKITAAPLAVCEPPHRAQVLFRPSCLRFLPHLQPRQIPGGVFFPTVGGT